MADPFVGWLILAFGSGVLSYWLAALKSHKLLREANDLNRAMLERYRAFVEGLAEASRRGIFPPELERHCQQVEIALSPLARSGAAARPPETPKTRQRSNTAQGEGSYPLVAGLPDRDGDGVPDKPPAIADVLAEVYADSDDSPPPAPGDMPNAIARVAALLKQWDDGYNDFETPREYRRALAALANMVVREAARGLDRELDLDRLVMLSAEVERLKQERDDALDAVKTANDAMIRAAAANSTSHRRRSYDQTPADDNGRGALYRGLF